MQLKRNNYLISFEPKLIQLLEEANHVRSELNLTLTRVIHCRVYFLFEVVKRRLQRLQRLVLVLDFFELNVRAFNFSKFIVNLLLWPGEVLLQITHTPNFLQGPQIFICSISSLVEPNYNKNLIVLF
ncbi:Hypothetical_protein [Hexamita inflata]|uniref:Hypothetical_protein n=1 Tax=Hexamita inflata TaxID=28002 RepID=A0AA86PJI3_9EUKA|nr:Hypothetical protein HINF_LOCUS27221 [Hexamita inflata]